MERMWKQETRRISDDMGINQSPVEFVKWFAGKVNAKSWTKNTFWLYKSAIKWYFGQSGPKEAFDLLQTIKAKGLPLKSDRTSSQKKKRLKGADLEKLLNKLRCYPEKIDSLVNLWIRAGLYSGLRPTEWENAFLEGNALKVKNAKHDLLRGNGEYRHIIFDTESHAEELQCIGEFLEALRSWQKKYDISFELLYAKCRKRLYYVTSHLWPRSMLRPTLYSTRHQFAANMKKSGLSKAEVAALMGHRSDETAGIHYARTKMGEVVAPPLSPDKEVATVLRKDTGARPAKKEE